MLVYRSQAQNTVSIAWHIACAVFDLGRDSRRT